MIPEFPKFKKLTVRDKEKLEQYTNQYPSYSDYNFASLLSWDIEENTLISLLHNNLVIKFNDYLTRKSFYSFIGINQLPETIGTLLKFASNQKIAPQLKLIPEVSVYAHHSIVRIFDVQEDRDNFDYLYHIPEMVKLTGNKHRAKRNFVNRFKKLYTSIHKILNLNNSQVQEEILNLIEVWEKTRHKDPLQTKHEFAAIKRMLAHSKYLTLLIIGLYIDSKLVGVSVNDILSQGHAINLFEKADIRLIGIYQYLRQITCWYLSEQGCQFLNHEQDLGIPGLRKSKLSFNPKFFLKKYIVSQKG